MVLFGTVPSRVSARGLSRWRRVTAAACVCLAEGDLRRERFLLHSMSLSFSANVFWVRFDGVLHRVSPAAAL